MILYIGGSKNIMVYILHDIMNFKGIIYFYDNNKKPRGIYVWQKKINII